MIFRFGNQKPAAPGKPRAKPADLGSRPVRTRIDADRLFNRPWFITSGALKAIVGEFVSRPAEGQAVAFAPDAGDGAPYPLTADGIACIPIAGPLSKDSWWRTTYGEIRETCEAALADSNCKALLLCFDSPGGEASGMFELADYLYSLRGKKPMAAISDDRCYSAAYCLASAADRVFVTRTGGTGSIGVWTAHADMSKMLEQEGIKVTFIFAGEKKVDGNAYEPLSDRAYADLKADVDRLRAMFVEAVARNRGVSADALYKTEAGIFPAETGIPLLADAVGTTEDALNYLRGRLGLPGSEAAPPPPPPEDEDDDDIEDDDQVAAQSRVLFSAPGHSGWFDHSFGPNHPSSGQILAFRSFGTVALAGAESGRPARISGLLAPYGSQSCDLGGFRERYEPGCFTEWLKSGEDAAVVYSHNVEKVLGRMSAGTARFWEEADGLHYQADLPDTQAGRDVEVSAGRGDIRGASAGFFILKHRWETGAGGRVRVIEQARLLEGSPYAFPAYTGSTVTAESAAPAAGNELELFRARQELLNIA